MALDWVIGIDPGATGALSCYDVTNAKVIYLEDMPYKQIQLTTGKNTKRVDVDKLREMLEYLKMHALEANANLHVHIEQVQAYGRQSAPAAFNFGYAAAIPYVMCKMLNLAPRLIHPNTWKNQFSLKASDKDTSRLLTIKLFPYLKDKLRRKMDVDRADAVLIAAYKPRL